MGTYSLRVSRCIALLTLRGDERRLQSADTTPGFIESRKTRDYCYYCTLSLFSLLSP